MNTIIVLALISLADFTLQAEWSYDYETQWPGVCTTGQLQSPINIMTQFTVVDKEQVYLQGPLQFRGYQDVPLSASNNGHTLKWSGVDGKPAPLLSGGPLRGNYTFLQFHLHWLSEHAINGMKFPMEIHMVHIKTGLTLEEAVQRSDGLAVVGVFCMVHNGYGSQRALEEIMPVIPYITNSAQNRTEPYNVDITRMLSPEPQSYFTYHGSLTTPLCQEVVTWIVMDKPIYITDEQYKMFSKVDVGAAYNYRSLQPANNRVVYRSMASCSSILVPSLTGSLVSILSCLSSTLASGINKSVCTIMNLKRKLFGDSVKNCVKYN